MTDWNGKLYHSFDFMIRERYGEKVYKVTLDAGMTCPNRDGKLGTRGCIFCSAGGSGDFAGNRSCSITEQIDAQISLIRSKRPVRKFIAYFQAYTNTYAPVSRLEEVFMEAVHHPDIVGVSVGTRPDCLPDDVLDLLDHLNRIRPFTVELGLQTMHEKTAAYIRRGYKLSCFEKAVHDLRLRDIEVVVHTILGLPGENREDMLDTIRYLNTQEIQGIKLQLLHVLEGTDLKEEFLSGKFQVLSEEEYLDIVISCLELLRPDIVIHRLTGDGPSDLLIAPLWASRKRDVLNHLHHLLKLRKTWQGRLYT